MTWENQGKWEKYINIPNHRFCKCKTQIPRHGISIHFLSWNRSPEKLLAPILICILDDGIENSGNALP